ncbi:ABC transporter permease [Marinococcus sp. PL1-022]|uniref:ABC transporter permease n=1 Tax=Marinococcus sp. PL1-022 TaxID=3095363 RepID=UPI0029C4BFB7|nr:ABC transporter permease subunit [Marinococcus sp. PL1-022]MDX6154479.1 ABC transporter permease subunit [Marinococcus sp. PL1-022]
MLGLVKNEIKKEFVKKTNYIILVAIILASFLYVLAPILFVGEASNTYSSGEGWKKDTQESIVERENENASIQNSSNNEELSFNDSVTVEANNATIEKLNYHLENDIPPADSFNLFDNLAQLSNFTIILSVLAIFLASSIVSKEFNIGTIKLLLIRPYSRNQILGAKYIAMLVIITLFLATLILSTSIFSMFFASINPTINYVLESNSGYTDVNFISYLSKMIIGDLFYLFIVATVAFAISTITNSSKAALSLSLLLVLMGSSIVNTVAARTETGAKYLLMSNWDLNNYLVGNSPPISGLNYSFSAFVSILYLIIIVFFTFYVFNKKDVTV